MTDLRESHGRSAREAPREPLRPIGGGAFLGATTPLSPPDRQRRGNILYGFFIVQTLALTMFQKIGFGGSIDSNVPFVLIAMAAGLGIVLAFVRPVFDVTRLALYIAFVGVAGIATSVLSDSYSPGSYLLLVVLYLPMAFSFPTSDGNYRRCMNFFSNVMVAMAAIALLQHVVQIASSWLVWPNLDQLLPQNMLVQGFNYNQKISATSRLMKPQAVFFLEVSFLSQYLAIALAAEIVLFQRLWRVALFAGTMFLIFAGTGLLLMLLTLPVLLGRSRITTMTMVVAGLVVVAWIAFQLGWFDIVAARTQEYQRTGASANLRFVAPLDRMTDFLRTSPGSFIRGIGAGQIEKVGGAQWWPITKAVVEYGLLAGVLFYAFVFYALMSHPPYRRLAFLLAVWFSIEGALLTAVNPLTCALFSTLFVLDRGPKRQRRSDKPERVEAAAEAPRRRRSRSSPGGGVTA